MVDRDARAAIDALSSMLLETVTLIEGLMKKQKALALQVQELRLKITVASVGGGG